MPFLVHEQIELVCLCRMAILSLRSMGFLLINTGISYVRDTHFEFYLGSYRCNCVKFPICEEMCAC